MPMSAETTPVDRTERLRRKIAAACNGEKTDAVLSALLSGVVTMIGMYPRDTQAAAAEKFAEAVRYYLFSKDSDRERGRDN